VHTISFYSFKGGVGRTLALVNVGFELAMTGRKVLLVDFDLEAPGIDTFEELRAPDAQLGLVDYVTDFMTSGTPPDVSKYVYQASLPEQARGELRVMAAGRRSNDYGQKLAAIDWQHLYNQMEGYLFIEDLKSQWTEKLQPDYVLIDSRTGHTEVGGICTRQLPDTVVIVFMPNEQNLRGLKHVVDAIRHEMSGPASKTINIEFVASNVPNLDDEEAIFSRMMRKFNNELGFRRSHLIQRYDSLALLNQTIFVTQRPKSRLARQYRTLLQRLAEYNIEDRAGALRFLERQIKADYYDSLDSRQEVQERVKAIADRHANDPDISFNSALFYKEVGLLDQSSMCFERAVELARQAGAKPAPRYLLERAESRVAAGCSEDAKQDLLEVIGCESTSSLELIRAIELLRRIDEDALVAVAKSPAIQNFDPDEAGVIASALGTSRCLQEIAETILVAARGRSPDAAEKSDPLRMGSALVFIALGKFREAMASIGEDQVFCQAPHIRDAFNYAMASWGATEELPTDLLRKVVELDNPNLSGRVEANYEECLALCLGLLGRKAEARARLASARRCIEKSPLPTFSCWNYMTVKSPVFEEHLKAIGSLIEGATVLPEFMASKHGN
jgi:MinD-like ATPase involved in chromosome partitioning or flagellar assembly